MRIKVLEKTLKLNVENKLKDFSEGDEVTVEDTIGKTCVQFGWAEDLDGGIPTGDRLPGANGKLEIANVKTAVSTK